MEPRRPLNKNINLTWPESEQVVSSPVSRQFSYCFNTLCFFGSETQNTYSKQILIGTSHSNQNNELHHKIILGREMPEQDDFRDLPDVESSKSKDFAL